MSESVEVFPDVQSGRETAEHTTQSGQVLQPHSPVGIGRSCLTALSYKSSVQVIMVHDLGIMHGCMAHMSAAAWKGKQSDLCSEAVEALW